jgi:deoxyribodipyrimidine photo-lyase
MKSIKNALVWFRRDLRDYDHAALYHALNQADHVYCVFVFDTDILHLLNNKADRRVEFIWHSLNQLKQSLQKQGGDLLVKYGSAREVIPATCHDLNINAVFSNRDYEPLALNRDAEVEQKLASANITFMQYKDQVIFERDEILTQQGKPYSVFTPYKNAVLKNISDEVLMPYAIDDLWDSLAKTDVTPMLSLSDIGFTDSNLTQLNMPLGMTGAAELWDSFQNRMTDYHNTRNFPAVKGPSYLSVHLRFGTISIRQIARHAWHQHNAGAETWLNELIWRDFYFQILHHRPDLAEGNSFKAEFNHLPFPNREDWFAAWCEGRTGFPIVDAAMRQLNQTGYMHNRLRMVAASFLVKDLLIDWRWGERYFAEHLIDFDFSANNGGWQWAASTGCDAQPWFRIFNPITQSEKFDPEGKFIRKYIPELAACHAKEIHAPWLIPLLRQQEIGLNIGQDYPAPIVDHGLQRTQALALYKNTTSPV